MNDLIDLWQSLSWIGRLFYTAAVLGSFAVIAFVLYVFMLGLGVLL